MYVLPRTKEVLKRWRKSTLSKCKRYVFAYSLTDGVLTIYTDHPGYLIGYQGRDYYNHINKIKETDDTIVKVTIVEVTTS